MLKYHTTIMMTITHNGYGDNNIHIRITMITTHDENLDDDFCLLKVICLSILVNVLAVE